MAITAYKYRSNIDIRQDTFSLLKNEIYAPLLSQLNDPFEETVISFLTKVSKINIEYDKINNLLEQIKNNVGIYSLSLKKEHVSFPNNELMWAHYANSHKGFCPYFLTSSLI